MLDLDTAEFVTCYRWMLELYHSQHEHPIFVSVDESKTDDARSISPTSVDDVNAACHGAAAAVSDIEQTAVATATQAPSAKRRLEASLEHDNAIPSDKKARRHSDE